MRYHLVLWLLVLPLVLASCGDCDDDGGTAEPDGRSAEDAIQGTTWVEEVPSPPQTPGSQKEYVKLDLPQAMHARTLDPRNAVVFNVLLDGQVTFKGNTFPLATGTPEEDAASREALASEVAQQTEGQGAKPLLLHAHRLAPWSTISTLLVDAMGWDVPPTKIAIAAFRPPDGWQHALGGTWREAGAETAIDRDAVPVSVAFRERNGGTQLFMVVGRNHWSLNAMPESFDDARFLKSMNRTWRKVADYLQTDVRGERYATLTVPADGDRVWLAHVVTLLDLLAGAGVEEVLFPVEGLRLRFEGR